MPDIITTGKLYCTANVHAVSSRPDTNNAGAASIACGRHSDGYQAYGFFAFEDPGVPKNAVIVSAELGGAVYSRLQAKDFALTVRPCAGAWTETGLTYRNMPASTGVSASVTMGDAGDSFSADITAIAQAWADGNFALADGLYITSSEGSSYKRVYGRESTEARRPYISLAYYVPASQPTADAASAPIAAGTSVNIQTNRLSADYTHALSWQLGEASGVIASAAGDSAAWTLTDAEVSAMLAALPDSTSGACRIICETFDAAGASIGTAETGITLTVPDAVAPVIASVTVTGIDLTGGSWVQGVSRAQVETDAAPGAGSLITSITVRMEGRIYTGNSVTTEPVRAAGEIAIAVTAADARGRSAESAQTITVHAYSAPQITAFAVERSNSTGTAAEVDGEYLRFSLAASASDLGGVNRLIAKILTKPRSAADWTVAGAYEPEGASLSVENYVLAGTYSPLSSYDVLLAVSDTVGTVARLQTIISTQNTLLNFDPANMRIKAGAVAEDTDPTSAFISALNAYFLKEIYLADGSALSHVLALMRGTQISGNPATVDLPAGGFAGAVAAFAPRQAADGAISGMEKVTVSLRGRNLLDVASAALMSESQRKGLTPAVDGEGRVRVTGTATTTWANLIECETDLPAGDYVFSAHFEGSFRAALTLTYTDGTTESLPVRNGQQAAITTAQPATKWMLHTSAMTAGTAYDITLSAQLETGAAAHEWQPHFAREEEVDLGGTVYGAEVDFAAGVWLETWGYIESYAGETLPDGWISSTGALDTGAQVAYPRITPVRHTFSPMMLALEPGENIISTDADGLTVTVAGGSVFRLIAHALNGSVALPAAEGVSF